MRKIEKLYLMVIVLLTACAPAIQQGTATKTPNVHRVASREIVYSVDDLVARGYAHAGTLNLAQVPPFYVLLSDDGWSCVVNDAAYAAASLDSLTPCRWVRPRGGR